MITYQARDEGEKDPGITGLASLSDILGTYGKLGWELASFDKIGKGSGAFEGSWEAMFKRPLIAKGAGR